MGGIFNMDSKPIRIVIKIFDAMCISVLWLIMCIPIVTAGAATTALYATAYGNLRKDQGYLFRTFWTAFRENWKRSTVIGLVYIGVLVLLGVDVLVFRTHALQGHFLGGLYWLILVLCAAAVNWGAYLFAYAARINGTAGDVLKNSFLLMIIHPIKALVIFVPLAGGILLSLSAPILLTVFPVAVCLLSSFTLEGIFAAHLPAENDGDTDCPQ